MPSWNPLVFLHFIGYISRITLSALSSTNGNIKLNAVKYKKSEIINILFDLILILILIIQIFLFKISGCSLSKFVLISFISYTLTSSFLMAYIQTNHFINPIVNENDPLVSSTSVKVPKIFDFLHFNFSYHTEHHVFPNMNSDYYPEVSRLLKKNFPEKYNRISIFDAWRRLWKNDVFNEKKKRIKLY